MHKFGMSWIIFLAIVLLPMGCSDNDSNLPAQDDNETPEFTALKAGELYSTDWKLVSYYTTENPEETMALRWASFIMSFQGDLVPEMPIPIADSNLEIDFDGKFTSNIECELLYHFMIIDESSFVVYQTINSNTFCIGVLDPNPDPAFTAQTTAWRSMYNAVSNPNPVTYIINEGVLTTYTMTGEVMTWEKV